jgi:type I restriction enzyme, S subunit
VNEWPGVVLSDLLHRAVEPATLDPELDYHEVTIRLWGKGVVSRGKVRGADVTTPRRFVRSGQLILSKIDARNGALGMVPPELDGAIVSNDFPSFALNDGGSCLPGFLNWLVQSKSFVDLCKASSEGTTNRVRIKEYRFLQQKIPLPPLAEQHAIVARLDALVDKTRQLTTHLDAIEADADQLLAQQFQAAIADAPYRPMVEVAPLVRRQAIIEPDASYPELGIRSFGKGTFHKPAVRGLDLGSKRLFRSEAGDLLFSNVFAWEGAIAIAGPEDAGRFGSHRFMTCTVDAGQVLSDFLLYYLLSPEGLEKVREASPGGAGRNRTLGVEKLAKIKVPAPLLAVQQAFVDLQATVSALKERHTAIREDNVALLPATLERLFTSQPA